MKFLLLILLGWFLPGLESRGQEPKKSGTENAGAIIFGGGFVSSYVEITAQGEVLFNGYLSSDEEAGFAASLAMPNTRPLKIQIHDFSIDDGFVELELKVDSEPFIFVQKVKGESAKPKLSISRHWKRPNLH